LTCVSPATKEAGELPFTVSMNGVNQAENRSCQLRVPSNNQGPLN
jgi:hypothetical protein